MKDCLSLIIVCLIMISFLCDIHVLILVKLANWSNFVWLLLLSLWIVSCIYGYRFYSIIFVNLRFGLSIDWICFKKKMLVMIELQLHVWIQRQFWVVMFKLKLCMLLFWCCFLSLEIDFTFVSVAKRFAVFWNKFYMLWFIGYVHLCV
jgi:hypothetical protein